MKFIGTIIVAILSVAVMAAPAADPVADPSLERRGKCPAGYICDGGKCHTWFCNQGGCWEGAATSTSC
ncbi:hypothetical protein TWF694_003020 [Orbilia ellipsospora]|uniref:Uncharacterized protein n=1 Tax=Orbilia ellipsospora TaxID=2528407 RepID=A0AAV9X0B9_9PEZI